MRAIYSGQATYASSCARGGYAQSLGDLAKVAGAGNAAFVSPDIAANGVVKSGYIVNVGPGRDAIASVTRTEIRKVALRDANPADGTLLKPDRLDRNSSTLAVFRPKLPEQSATPPTQIIRH